METLYYQRETICFFSVEVGRRSKGSEIFCKKCEEENMKILLDSSLLINFEIYEYYSEYSTNNEILDSKGIKRGG